MTSIQTFLGATPVNTISSALGLFVPTNHPVYATLNAFANATFTTPPYNEPTQDGNISVSKLIDQPTYQNDPVNQAILNILNTRDYTYCMSNDNTSWTGGNVSSSGGIGQNTSAFPTCTYLSDLNVGLNILGIGTNSNNNNAPPSPSEVYSYDYNQQFLSQLNSNTLISPLLYSTSGSSTSQSAKNSLPSQSQAQQAANFIRYATSAVTPIKLPTQSEYANVFTAAITSPGTANQVRAQYGLTNFLTSLRVFAAQNSVAIGNLYYILNKRLPQNVPVSSTGGSSPGSNNSQALSEFIMATRRLFNTDPSQPSQWLTQINSSSPATVQKEMVALLAEINFQLYLNRQQEERLLLTNSMLLLRLGKQMEPSLELPTAEDN
jgi:intracellular multiplication protein IcmX